MRDKVVEFWNLLGQIAFDYEPNLLTKSEIPKAIERARKENNKLEFKVGESNG